MNPFETNIGTGRKMKPAKNLSFEETFLDMQMEDSEVLDDERDHINYRVLGSVLVLSLALLAVRIFQLQVVQGHEYRAMAEGNKARIQYTLAPRGQLLDRNGKVIASNTPSFEAVVVPADLPKDSRQFQASLSQVTSILGQNYDDLLNTIKNMNQTAFQAQTLVPNITKDQALVLIGKQDQLPGFSVENTAIRDYKDGDVFAHVVGYTGKVTASELAHHKDQNYLLNDYIGKTGLEYEYETYLRGVPGQKQAEVDARGQFQKALADVPPQPGDDMKVSIDYDLQKVLYDALVAQVKKAGVSKGAVVATNPKTGEVLALISLPTFDNNMFARGITSDEYKKLIGDTNNPLLDRAISGTYPPGSTIKPVMATAGLTEGVITTQTKILDDGVIRVGNFTFYGYEHGGLGIMDVYSAIAKSSDIYFYTVGGGNTKTGFQGLGPDRIATWFRKFHLGQALGIDLPGEKSGLVPDPGWKQQVKNEQWYLGDTYHESIGQGDLLVTPLQVNSWTTTIANGGKIMQPYVMEQITDHNGKVVSSNQPKVLAQNVFDPSVIKIVADGMRDTVTEGSGRALNSLPIPVSAKTGTAQFDPHNPNRYHAWFTSYAPSDNPQIAITVLVEGGGEGYAVAGPVAKAGYAWWTQNRYNK